MRNVLGVLGVVVVGLFACGSPSPTEVEVQVGAQAPVITTAPAQTPAPAANHAADISVGLIYAGNMLGELEPCG